MAICGDSFTSVVLVGLQAMAAHKQLNRSPWYTSREGSRILFFIKAFSPAIR